MFQKREDIAKFGETKSSWYLGWRDLDGRCHKKSFGRGFLGKKTAETARHKLEEQLLSGDYRANSRKSWSEFCQEYQTKVLAGLAPATREAAMCSLAHFERLVKPRRVFGLSTTMIDEFIAKRRQDPGKKAKSFVSPASINKDLRHLKAALHVAHDWGDLRTMPKFRTEKEPGKHPPYVSGDHFAAMYQACEKARKPKDIPNVRPVEWWQALLVMGYMTGWRISDMLALRKERLDLEAGTAFSRAKDNKGKRDELIKLHPVVVEHLRRLQGAKFASPLVFPWSGTRAALYVQFARIQEAAGIHLPCDEDHEHSRFCYVYGFHALRRAFATMNADNLTPEALQALMRHKNYQTTLRYINYARQMDAAVASLHIPEVLKNSVL
jgi:integrase